MTEAMHVRRVPIGDLREDETNPNMHPPANLDAIRASLERWHQVEPLVVQKGTGMVIGGHGRLRIMRDLGWQFVDVVEQDLPVPEARALGLTLNQSAKTSEWNVPMLSAQMTQLAAENVDVRSLGWRDADLKAILNGQDWRAPGMDGDASGGNGAGDVPQPVTTGLRNLAYQPPFPWFGGKSAVAGVVWAALGDPKNYVEPFFGSGAVLFLRPPGDGSTRIETVNDADALLSNFWRALQKSPDAVAAAADWPVNEADLHARHIWLVRERPRITERLMGDPEFCDPKAAGWWAWGMSCWIGSGWCSGTGPWFADENGVMVDSRQLPHLGDAGRGVNRQLPHLGDAGQGVNRQLPHLGNPGRGEDEQGECAARSEYLRAYMRGFADRLRGVRVCCGDWSRVTGPSVTTKHGLTGVFLDPPYADSASRTTGLYAKDDLQVAHAVREWAVAHGDDPLLRIVLAGYDGEHSMPPSWRVFEWATPGGFGSQGKDGSDATGKANKRRERLWFSPHCLDVRDVVAVVLEPEVASDVDTESPNSPADAQTPVPVAETPS